MRSRIAVQGGFPRRFILRAALALAVLAALSSSCARVIGWGVVLWPPEAQATPSPGGNSPGGNSPGNSSPLPGGTPGSGRGVEDASALSPGDIVPVYLKSMIQKIYAVGVPGTKAKTELALWRLEYFGNRAAAKRFRAAMGDLAYQFAITTRDGLPVHSKPINDPDDKVYRLREFETVKILSKAAGAAVETGGAKLAGDWYSILTADGTRGYVFSNTLKMFDSRSGTAEESRSSAAAARDDSIDLVLAKTWRPEYFARMIEDGRYDLKDFSLKYGLFSDLGAKRIRLEVPTASRVFDYESTVKLRSSLFGFEGNQVRIQVRADDLITVEFPLSDGKTRSEVFVTVEEDIESLIRAEESRRQGILSSLMGPSGRLASEAYGTISISVSRRFSWKDYGTLSPLVIPAGYGETGELAFDGYVDEALAKDFGGVLSFRFDGAPPSSPVRFYYALTAEGLRLEQVPSDAFDPTGLVAEKRASGPIVAFFSRAE